jgi:uncharacterized protein (TIGR02453 family)
MSTQLSKRVFDFLENLRANNNRAWFEKHKNEFLAIQSNFKAFIAGLLPQADIHFPGAGLLKPEQCMYRIYRDVRFSKNKLPYKTNISALIGPLGRKSGFDAVYLHIENDSSFLATGAYELMPEQLAAIRQEIDYNADEFKSIIYQPQFKNYFGNIEGNQLKTSPKGYPADHPEIQYLRYTQFYVSHPFTNEEVLRADFADQVIEGIKTALPFSEFLIRATAQPQ